MSKDVYFAIEAGCVVIAISVVIAVWLVIGEPLTLGILRGIKKAMKTRTLKDMSYWEEKFPIGTEVWYFPTMDQSPLPTKIRSKPWVLGCGEIVIKIDGQAGGVSVYHLAYRDSKERE